MLNHLIPETPSTVDNTPSPQPPQPGLLKMEDITDSDYMHANRVSKDFEINKNG